MFAEAAPSDAAKTAAPAQKRAPVFLEKLFRFFASLKLAIFVLASLMTVLAAGTIVESLHGAEAAKILVYDTWWFGVILFCLGVNVLAATLDRLPWKKKHIGFVVTHLGIITILTGAFLSRHFMVDGQMPIAEGETGSAITLSEPLVYIFSQNLRRDWIVKVPPKAFPWKGNQKLALRDAPFELRMRELYPKARVHETLQKAEAGPAALKVTLHNSFVNQSQWLVENDPQRQSVSAGPAKLIFSGPLLKESVEKPSAAGTLEFAFQNHPSVFLPVPEELVIPQTQPLAGTPYQVTFRRVLKNAMVVGRDLVDQPEEKDKATNPAVEFLLEGEGLRENHTVFARFPDFPTVHGMKPSAAGVKVYYRLPDAEAPNNELRFAMDAEKGLMYQVSKGTEMRSDAVPLGQDVETGWMDLKFTVDEFYPHAAVVKAFEPQPSNSEAEDLTSAVQVEISAGGETQTLWLEQGVRQKITLGQFPYDLVYGQKRIPLGFKVELRDFKIENDPGTNQPASFSSDVTMKDDMRGVVRDTTISMNKPLEYQGYKIYQAAYSLAEGQPEVSVFAVGKDPGVAVKYLGAVIMIGGIITMFSMRKLYQTKSS